jgi:hypothetical protein
MDLRRIRAARLLRIEDEMRLATLGALGLLFVGSVSACSSEQTSLPPSEEPWPDNLSLRGTYEAKGEGAISKVTFTKDGKYILRDSRCAAASCEQQGRYALDPKTRTLALTPAVGEPRTLPFEVISAAKAPAPEGSLVPKTVPPEDLTQDPEKKLVSDPSTVLEPGTVQSALVNDQPVELVTFAGTCLLTQLETGLVEGGEGKCGFYEDRPECDSNDVISYYASDVAALVSDTIACGGCGALLVGSAIVAAGGTVASDGALAIPAGKLAAAIAAWGCVDCWRGLQESGVMTAVDCALVPCAYTEEGNQKLCQMSCDTAYAYIPQVGTKCQCTNDAVEACCRINCGAYPDSEIHADDCLCHRKGQ